MYNILYPTDLTDQSLKIAGLAADLARSCNAQLHILHVNAIPMISTDMPADALDNLIRSQEELSNRQMEQFKSRLSGGAMVHGEVRTGVLTESINEYADAKQIDLILMATHGSHGMLEKFFIGTNTEKVMKRSKLPIFVIPDSIGSIHIRNILYATDLESDETHALVHLRKFADTLKAEVSAIHVDNDSSLDIFNDKTLADRLKGALGQNIRLHSIKTDKVREGLEEFAETHKYDMISATRVDRGLLDNFFHSSLTSDLVYNSRMPLLILHN